MKIRYVLTRQYRERGYPSNECQKGSSQGEEYKKYKNHKNSVSSAVCARCRIFSHTSDFYPKRSKGQLYFLARPVKDGGNAIKMPYPQY